VASVLSLYVYTSGKGTHDDVVSSCIWAVLKVKRDKMLSKTSIAHLINLIKDEVEEIKSRNKSRWEIDVGWNR